MDEELRALLVEGAAALGAELGEKAIGQFDVHLQLLRLWGRRMNLTATLDAREIVTRHFLDSLAGCALIGEGDEGRLLDLGSGAGFPGLPLKVARPGLRVVLLDGTRKKVSFCRQVIREAGLEGISAEWGRAEERRRDPAFSGAFTWVTTRAVGKAAELVELSLPFLAPSGTILAYKGDPARDELNDLDALAASRNLAVTLRPVRVPGLEAARCLIAVTVPPAASG